MIFETYPTYPTRFEKRHGVRHDVCKCQVDWHQDSRKDKLRGTKKSGTSEELE